MNYIPEVPVTYIDEKNIICLSDKLRQEETLVTLEERLEPVKKKWKDDPEALNIIETKINAADAVVTYMTSCASATPLKRKPNPESRSRDASCS